MTADLRQHSSPSARNRGPILAVLEKYLPAQGEGLVFEVASGSGMHTAFFAEAFSHLTFQPSDPDEAARASIKGWIEHEGLTNVRTPLHVDAMSVRPDDLAFETPVVAMVNINMIHISPWAACEGLMATAARVLSTGAHLFMYGPYARDGGHTAPSNAAFDESLRARNPAWGIRHLEEVVACAEKNGLTPVEVLEMPANNLSVVYRR